MTLTKSFRMLSHPLTISRLSILSRRLSSGLPCTSRRRLTSRFSWRSNCCLEMKSTMTCCPWSVTRSIASPAVEARAFGHLKRLRNELILYIFMYNVMGIIVRNDFKDEYIYLNDVYPEFSCIIWVTYAAEKNLPFCLECNPTRWTAWKKKRRICKSIEPFLIFGYDRYS